jgi:hypothetical protein
MSWPSTWATALPNPRVQRTRSSASPLHSPLTRHPLGDTWSVAPHTVSNVGLGLRRFLLALLYLGFLSPELFGQSPAFACTPTVDFGTVPVGQFTLGSFWCTNTQAVPVAFDYAGTVGEDFQPNPCVGGVCYDTIPMVIPPGGSFGVTVAFQPTALGPRLGSQTILNDAGLPNSVITFTGIGGNVTVPMLDKRTALIFVVGLSLVAIFVIHNGGRRAA